MRDTGRVLWATDSPRPEYRAGVVDELRELAPLPETARARILGRNAVDADDLGL